MNEPLASIIVTSYNHEKYIKEALDSILLQEVNFEYKVYLADDCSTDNTREILKEYMDKYPQIFVAVYPEMNLGLVKNMKNAFDKSKGKYIFMLEGDDYWTSKFKMQKQVDFLENNHLSPMVANCLWVKDEINNKNFPNFVHFANDIVSFNNIFYLTTSSIIKTNYIGNFSSIAFRRDVLNKLENRFFEEKLWDWLFSILLSRFGPIGFINEPMSVYRLVNSAQWSSKTRKEQVKDILTIIQVYDRLLDYDFHLDFKNLENRLKFELTYIKDILVLKNPLKESFIKIRNKLLGLSFIYTKLDSLESKLESINEVNTKLDSLESKLEKSAKCCNNTETAIEKLNKLISEAIKQELPIKLHLACGTIYKEGWINIDDNSDNNIEKLDLNWNLVNKLPLKDESIDFIYHEHFIEHLTYRDGQIFFKQVFDLLKRGGIMRIACPDLDVLIDDYVNDTWKDKSWIKKYNCEWIKTRGEMINVSMNKYPWGHQYLYNKEDLMCALVEAGFEEINIKQVKVNESEYTELQNLETRIDSMVFEVRK